MLKESSGAHNYTLPPVQTPAEYEADSNETIAWFLKTFLFGELGVLAASNHGWRSDWQLLLAVVAGLAVGLLAPNPVRFFRRRGGLTNAQTQGILWVMGFAHLILIAAISIGLHSGDF